MDPLDKTTSCNVDFSQAARTAYEQGKINTCKKVLSEHLYFLIDELIGSAPEPCESSEPSKG